MCLTISGREIAETSGYSFMYRPLALIVGRQYSLANSSRASTTMDSTAPAPSARWRTVSMSSPPWPRSMDTAMTSALRSLAIQLMATVVSRPPEYASTTRSFIEVSFPRFLFFF